MNQVYFKPFRLHQKAIQYGDEDQKSMHAKIKSNIESEVTICDANKTKLKNLISQFDGIIAGVNTLINDLGLDFKVNHSWELLEGLGLIETNINTLKAAKVSFTTIHPSLTPVSSEAECH